MRYVVVHGALGAPLVQPRADLPGDLSAHQHLGQHPYAVAERIDVVLLEQLADGDVRSIL